MIRKHPPPFRLQILVFSPSDQSPLHPVNAGKLLIEWTLDSITASPDLCMRMLNLFLTVMVLAPVASAYSFYDNPEQDPLPPTGPDSDEELHKKWDVEVYCSANASHCFGSSPYKHIVDPQ